MSAVAQARRGTAAHPTAAGHRWWQGWDSNPRRTAYEAAALPLSYPATATGRDPPANTIMAATAQLGKGSGCLSAPLSGYNGPRGEHPTQTPAH